MEGKINLNALPDSLKSLIVAKYGSLDKFYDTVYHAGVAHYMATVVNKDLVKKQELERHRYETVLELEAWGQSVGLDIDGAEIYDGITGDFDEQRTLMNY